MNRSALMFGCLLFGLFARPVSAQEASPPIISNFEMTYSLTIDPAGQITKMASLLPNNFPFEVDDVKLVHGDLTIQFQLREGLTGQEMAFEIRNMRLQAAATTALLPEQTPGLNSGRKWLTGDTDIKKLDQLASYSLTWMNVQEQFRYPLRGTFELSIQVVGKGFLPINCQQSYEFNTGKKLAHVGAAAVGVGFIVWGLAQNTKANNLYYDQYLERTVNDDETKRLLELSNSRRHEYLIMTYGGLAILGADLLWYVLREKKLKNYQLLKEKYCGVGEPGFFLQPKAGFGPGGRTAQLGFSLSINLNK